VPCPAADAGDHLLPPELRDELQVPSGALDEQTLLHRVLDLMPALDYAQTRAMIGTFLEEPARFLAAIDLPGLVDRLLARATELPRRLRAELRLLARRLKTFTGNPAGLFRLGMRIVTIITLVVIIAHLAVPDAVYGKGSTGGEGGTPALAHAGPDTGGFNPDPPTYATGGGYRGRGIGSSQTVDETGTLYPPRSYRYHPRGYYGRRYRSYRSNPYGSHPSDPAQQASGIYRLTPEADVLPDGQVVIGLTDSAYLLIGDQVDAVVDRQSGEPLIFLERDPALLRRVATELQRQQLGLQQSADAKLEWMRWVDWLQFTPWYEDDRRELQNLREMRDRLEEALRGLGEVPETQPPLPQPPVPGALEVFSSVWLLQDDSALAVKLPENELAFVDGTGWYKDQARKQPREGTYPKGFVPVVVAYLNKNLNDMSATRTRVEQEMSAAQADLTSLQRDVSDYEGLSRSGTADSDDVDYGTSEIPLGQALQRTYADLATTQQRIADLRRQLDALPSVETSERRFLDTLKQQGVQ
jgi:spermidine synthase